MYLFCIHVRKTVFDWRRFGSIKHSLFTQTEALNSVSHILKKSSLHVLKEYVWGITIYRAVYYSFSHPYKEITSDFFFTPSPPVEQTETLTQRCTDRETWEDWEKKNPCPRDEFIQQPFSSFLFFSAIDLWSCLAEFGRASRCQWSLNSALFISPCAEEQWVVLLKANESGQTR